MPVLRNVTVAVLKLITIGYVAKSVCDWIVIRVGVLGRDLRHGNDIVDDDRDCLGNRHLDVVRGSVGWRRTRQFSASTC